MHCIHVLSTTEFPFHAFSRLIHMLCVPMSIALLILFFLHRILVYSSLVLACHWQGIAFHCCIYFFKWRQSIMLAMILIIGAHLIYEMHRTTLFIYIFFRLIQWFFHYSFSLPVSHNDCENWPTIFTQTVKLTSGMEEKPCTYIHTDEQKKYRDWRTNSAVFMYGFGVRSMDFRFICSSGKIRFTKSLEECEPTNTFSKRERETYTALVLVLSMLARIARVCVYVSLNDAYLCLCEFVSF